MISLNGAVSVVLYLLVGAAIFGILFWLNEIIPTPAPAKGWIRIVIYVLGALVAIGFLLSLIGGQPMFVR